MSSFASFQAGASSSLLLQANNHTGEILKRLCQCLCLVLFSRALSVWENSQISIVNQPGIIFFVFANNCGDWGRWSDSICCKVEHNKSLWLPGPLAYITCPLSRVGSSLIQFTSLFLLFPFSSGNSIWYTFRIFPLFFLFLLFYLFSSFLSSSLIIPTSIASSSVPFITVAGTPWSLVHCSEFCKASLYLVLGQICQYCHYL